MRLCFDTYALVEIHNGNLQFSNLLDQEFVIPDIIMTEFYGDLYRKYNESTADYWLKKVGMFCKPVDRDTLIKAMKYRIDNAKSKLSFFDCVGYMYAIENNMMFVTGDKKFEKRKGVLYIK